MVESNLKLFLCLSRQREVEVKGESSIIKLLKSLRHESYLLGQGVHINKCIHLFKALSCETDCVSTTYGITVETLYEHPLIKP